MTKPAIALGDLVEVRGGGTPSKSNAAFWNGDIPWVSPKDMKSWEIRDAEDKITSEAIERSATNLIPENSILIVNRSGILKHTLPVGITRRPLAINQDLKALICGPRVHPEYLARIVKASEPVVLKWVRATTADNFPIENLRSLVIPLPRLGEQRRIATILATADVLRQKRKHVIGLLQGLTQSIFLEMFGDPLNNPKGWRTDSLQNVASFYSGNTLPTGKLFNGQSDGFLLLKVSDLNARDNSEVIVSAANWTADSGSKAGTCHSTAIVFPKRGGAIATNKKRKLYRPAILDPNLMAVAPAPSLLTIDYLYSWFQSFRLEDISSGSSVPQLNKQDLAPLTICIPPIKLQQQYSDFCQRIGRQAVLQRNCQIRLDVLFASLQQRALAGEL